MPSTRPGSGRRSSRPPVLVTRLVGLALTVVVGSASACSEAPSGPSAGPEASGEALPHDRYPDTVLGHAQLMRDWSPRIVRAVDVGDRFPDSGGVVRGAAVLIDARLGTGLQRTDFRGRPVLVRYQTRRDAERAVRHRRPGTFGIRWADVVYLPAHFPARASHPYRKAVTAALE